MEVGKIETGVFFCRCSAGIISEDKLNHIAEVVQKSGARVVELNDLCALSIDKAHELQKLNIRFTKKIMIACYPRAVENILNQASAPFQEMKVLNFRRLTSVEIEAELADLNGSIQENHEVLSSDLKVPAWFPVVEKKRCNNCGQCARFCLFGVYRYSDKQLFVENPLNCKNNCPACARSCPVSAIIFPRIKEDGVIAGAEPDEVRIDLSQQQPGSLLTRIQQRGDLRRSIFRSNLLQQAEEERRKAIEEFKKRNN